MILSPRTKHTYAKAESKVLPLGEVHRAQSIKDTIVKSVNLNERTIMVHTNSKLEGFYECVLPYKQRQVVVVPFKSGNLPLISGALSRSMMYSKDAPTTAGDKPSRSDTLESVLIVRVVEPGEGLRDSRPVEIVQSSPGSSSKAAMSSPVPGVCEEVAGCERRRSAAAAERTSVSSVNEGRPTLERPWIFGRGNGGTFPTQIRSWSSKCQSVVQAGKNGPTHRLRRCDSQCCGLGVTLFSGEAVDGDGAS